jgi:hypothetical protein
MLNRGINLIHLLDAIFTLPPDQLTTKVQEACVHYGHQPDQLTQQLEALRSPLYSYVPHQTLAQRNMIVMNSLGIRTMTKHDLPEYRTDRVLSPQESPRPFAEEVIEGYQELTSPTHNNTKEVPFVDRPEHTESGEEI